ncbi:MAG: phage tail protein [Acidobacteriota bacterium]
MAFTRTTLIDASPTGDSVKQAVLDLDADLTGAFAGLNQLLASLGGKISQGDYNQPQGVPRLDASAKIPSGLLPSLLAEGPIGMIAAFGMESLPAGCNWLPCDGAELTMADYPALYAAIGTSFGLAAEPSKFKLPDLRGYFLRGWDNNAHVDPDATSRSSGDAVGSTQSFDCQKHTHLVGLNGTCQAGGGFNTVNVGIRDGSGVFHTQDYTPQFTDAEKLDDYGVAGEETRPVNVAVLYCIKWR